MRTGDLAVTSSAFLNSALTWCGSANGFALVKPKYEKIAIRTSASRPAVKRFMPWPRGSWLRRKRAIA
jgi:hypothetical protein